MVGESLAALTRTGPSTRCERRPRPRWMRSRTFIAVDGRRVLNIAQYARRSPVQSHASRAQHPPFYGCTEQNRDVRAMAVNGYALFSAAVARRAHRPVQRVPCHRPIRSVAERSVALLWRINRRPPDADDTGTRRDGAWEWVRAGRALRHGRPTTRVPPRSLAWRE